MLRLIILSIALAVPTSLEQFQAAHPTRLSEGNYEAAQETTRRKSITVNLKSEDRVLGTSDRAKLISAARDLRRNSALCAWVIRRHLDFVSTFTFQCKSGVDQLDDNVQAIVKDWSEPEACDAAGRHSLQQLIRLSEAHRTIDGDILHVRLKSGRLQLITAGRIKNPHDTQARDGQEWKHGVLTAKPDRALAYSVWSENGCTLEPDRIIPAANARLHGYFDSADQVRGIGRLAAGLNLYRDTHSNIDLALARAKLASYFALKFKTAPDPLATGIDIPGHGTVTEHDDDGDGTTDREEVTVDLGGGPITLNLDEHEDAEFMESSHPSANFIEFHKAVIDLALLCVDLPNVMLRPTDTNFIGQQSALQVYKLASACKQQDNRTLLEGHTRWRLAAEVLSGRLRLPAGMTVENIPLEWVPVGIPWFDQSKETRGALLAIMAGLDNPQRVAREHNTDFYDNVDQLAAALKYARSKLEPYGVALRFDAPQEVINVKEVEDA